MKTATTQEPQTESVNTQTGGAWAYVKAHWQNLFNIYLFFWFTAYVGWRTWQTWQEGRLDFFEGTFIFQNMVMITLILVRQPHQSIDRNILHQTVSLVAFCSGIFFIGQPLTSSPAVQMASRMLILVANVLGMATLFNLGRSFGILIARRKIKTCGLYGIVRHPMYVTDILLRIGFLTGHFHMKLVLLFLLSSGCYVWRALLEERFLRQGAEYKNYMRQVRYRFIPGLF